MAIARASDRATVGRVLNPAMLETARHAQSMSQEEVGTAVGVSPAQIGKWESGISTPGDEWVEKLARALRVQPELLFVDRPRRLASMSDFYHRALSTASRTDVKAIHARCSIIDLQIDRLLQLAEMPYDLIPNIELNKDVSSVEDAAIRARQAMGAEPGPLKNLVELLERCHAIVIDRRLEVETVDALCRWVPELPKLFFVNSTRPADRMRFSLAHELAHTVLHFGRDYDHRTAEDHANRFAAAFLLPAKEFLADLRGSLTLPDLAALKRKWRVSMQAIAHRAWELGAITDSKYRHICIQMSKHGWRKVEPVEIDRESPRKFVQLLQLHLDSGYTREELAKLLFATPEQVEEMLKDATVAMWQGQGVRLRLVR